MTRGFAVCYNSVRQKGKAMQQFLERVAEVLEVPSVALDFEFRAAPGWSSLMGFALIVLLEQEYGARIGVDDFARLRTVADLAGAAGVRA